MPYLLDTPISRPRAVVRTVTGFNVDLVNMRLHTHFEDTDEAGKSESAPSRTSNLVMPNGAPRFTQEQYAMLRDLVYGINIEDGHLPAGEVI